MCTKRPRIQQPEQKDPQFLRNPYLDGLAIGAGRGRNSLRIDRADPLMGGFRTTGLFGTSRTPLPPGSTLIPRDPALGLPGTPLPDATRGRVRDDSDFR